MIYLASAYSHSDPLIRKTRFLIAEQVVAIAFNRGQFLYSPIVHNHELALKYEMPGDFTFWRRFNLDMLRRADWMYVLQIDGWKESEGVTYERIFAAQAGINISFINENGYVDGSDTEYC